MAAIDGIDVLFVGPADLSHALGIRGQLDHPDFDAAIRTVADAATANGKAAGIMLWKPEEAARYAALGYTLLQPVDRWRAAQRGRQGIPSGGSRGQLVQVGGDARHRPQHPPEVVVHLGQGRRTGGGHVLAIRLGLVARRHPRSTAGSAAAARP